jgi:mono/diheme cytochrome c family protein
MTKLIVLSLMTGLLAATAAGEAKSKADLSKLPPPSPTTGLTYSGNVKQVFEASCVKCHGPERSKAGLRLDSRDNALKGSEHGKVIVPGKSAESQLVHSIGYIGDEDRFMPPPENKAGIKRLTKEEVSLIRAWIDQGAK